jgi:zinc transport system substrate-binding protein
LQKKGRNFPAFPYKGGHDSGDFLWSSAVCRLITSDGGGAGYFLKGSTVRFFQYVIFAACFILQAFAPAEAENKPDNVPVVVASIAPLHSLLANVMAGVGEPLLLMRPGSSPHDYVMRPSEAQMLARADLIFWVGETGERVLLKPLSESKHRVVALLDENFPEALLLRPTGVWPEGFSKPAAGSKLAMVDPHIWLDPEIAAKIVKVMVRELSRTDPRHAGVYQENGLKTLDKIARLDASLRQRLQPVQAVPFMVYHDAFQYFEKRYGLTNVGSVAVNADVQPGVRRVAELKSAIRQKNVRCIFAEPQFSPALIRILVQGSNAKAGVADDLGAGLAPGREAYFQLMTALANSLASCLGTR